MPIIILRGDKMRIDNNIQPKTTLVKPKDIGKDQEEKESKVEISPKEAPAAIYEKSENTQVGHVYDKNAILKLKKDSEEAYSGLIRIVEDMLKRQGKSLALVKAGDMVKVDEVARQEAQDLIGPNGDLGVEAVSQRLVDFAIALSGGDKSKANTLRGAIEKGFKEAEKILGGLPDISKETYKLTMEKFDAWANEKE